MDVNVNGSLHVLKSYKNCNISKFIVISSAAVYGEDSQMFIQELLRNLLIGHDRINQL